MGIEKKREINKELFIIPVNTKKIGFENEDTKYQEARMITSAGGCETNFALTQVFLWCEYKLMLDFFIFIMYSVTFVSGFICRLFGRFFF